MIDEDVEPVDTLRPERAQERRAAGPVLGARSRIDQPARVARLDERGIRLSDVEEDDPRQRTIEGPLAHRLDPEQREQHPGERTP